MKQHITPKQLREVSKEKLIEIYGDFNGSALNSYRKDFYDYHHKKFTIGKMIEILFNKLGDINIETHNGGCSVITSEYILNDRGSVKLFINDPKNICDALWEMLKEVIN